MYCENKKMVLETFIKIPTRNILIRFFFIV